MAPKKVCYYCDFPHYHLQHATNHLITGENKNWFCIVKLQLSTLLIYHFFNHTMITLSRVFVVQD